MSYLELSRKDVRPRTAKAIEEQEVSRDDITSVLICFVDEVHWKWAMILYFQDQFGQRRSKGVPLVNAEEVMSLLHRSGRRQFLIHHGSRI